MSAPTPCVRVHTNDSVSSLVTVNASAPLRRFQGVLPHKTMIFRPNNLRRFRKRVILQLCSFVNYSLVTMSHFLAGL